MNRRDRVELRAMGALNQKVSKADLQHIRELSDFDLMMLISEVHDHGWPTAKKLLPLMRGVRT